MIGISADFGKAHCFRSKLDVAGLEGIGCFSSAMEKDAFICSLCIQLDLWCEQHLKLRILSRS